MAPIFSFEDNPVQEHFVKGEEVFSAYIGGFGAGKTFSNIVRTLLILGQPINGPEAPRGLIGGESYDVIDDVIMPVWDKCQNMIRHKAPNSPAAQTNYHRAKRRVYLKDGRYIDFRSLYEPQKIRGRELTTFGIDEGRNVSLEGWKRLYDRLRQPNYRRAGFVTSTPNGYDWMYDMFSPESGERWTDPYTGKPFKWYNASTEANKKYLAPEYIAGLKANLNGLELEQEFYGRFIGLTHGAVFPRWGQEKEAFTTPIHYDPTLPLYTGWDFGIGDPGVVVWFQIETIENVVPVGDKEISVYLKKVHVLDVCEEKNWTARDWADYFHEHIYNEYGKKKTNGNFGDPAGSQRNPSTGTSVIQDLNAAGVPISAARKRPEDYGVRILHNLIEGDRFYVNQWTCDRLSKALSSHKWPVDKNGNKSGPNPVHDWTSHFIAALRYGVSSVINFYPKRGEPPPPPQPPDGSFGKVIEDIVNTKDSSWLGPKDRSKQWLLGSVGLG